MCSNVEADPKMLRAEGKAVPEGNGPFLHDDYGSGGLPMEEIYRIFKEELDKCFDAAINHFDQRFGNMEEENKIAQRLAGLQHQAQQPRFATEADVKPDTKIRERTEGAAAVREKYGIHHLPGLSKLRRV